MTIPPHLRWACRRGMLELDVLLNNFLTEAYPTLTLHQQTLFNQLLENNDQDLFEWFMNKTQPNDPQIKLMVDLILSHARTRH